MTSQMAAAAPGVPQARVELERESCRGVRDEEADDERQDVVEDVEQEPHEDAEQDRRAARLRQGREDDLEQDVERDEEEGEPEERGGESSRWRFSARGGDHAQARAGDEGHREGERGPWAK